MTTISVIVPVYNGEATLGKTLASAQTQTHRDIEIIVVDDGSRDSSAAIAEAAAETDDRITILRTGNHGVAAARNAAIEHARGEFIAPLDADDLWHPRKLELQLHAFASCPNDTVLAYNWFVPVGAADQILTRPRMPMVSGAVYYRHLDYNFISNGSTPLVRRDALEGLRYDPELAANGVGGCEDYLFQLALALRGRFTCVPAFLTGYRKAGGGMSSKVEQMLRSHIAVLGQMRRQGPRDASDIIDRRLAEFEAQLARHRIRRGRILGAGMAAVRGALRSPKALTRQISEDFATLRIGKSSKPPTDDALTHRKFPTADPFEAIGVPIPPERRARLAPLESRDLAGTYLD